MHSLFGVTKCFVIFEVGLEEDNWCLNNYHAKFNNSVGKERPTRPRFQHQSHVVTDDAVTEEEAFAQSESVGYHRRGLFLYRVSTLWLSLLLIETLRAESPIQPLSCNDCASNQKSRKKIPSFCVFLLQGFGANGKVGTEVWLVGDKLVGYSGYTPGTFE